MITNGSRLTYLLAALVLAASTGRSSQAVNRAMDVVRSVVGPATREIKFVATEVIHEVKQAVAHQTRRAADALERLAVEQLQKQVAQRLATAASAAVGTIATTSAGPLGMLASKVVANPIKRWVEESVMKRLAQSTKTAEAEYEYEYVAIGPRDNVTFHTIDRFDAPVHLTTEYQVVSVPVREPLQAGDGDDTEYPGPLPENESIVQVHYLTALYCTSCEWTNEKGEITAEPLQKDEVSQLECPKCGKNSIVDPGIARMLTKASD